MDFLPYLEMAEIWMIRYETPERLHRFQFWAIDTDTDDAMADLEREGMYPRSCTREKVYRHSNPEQEATR